MELGLYIKFGEVRLGLEELLEIREGAQVNVEWPNNREVTLCFDNQSIAQGVLRRNEEELVFEVLRIPKGDSMEL